mgnify:CR=1 FL=1
MTEAIIVNLMKNKIISDRKDITWPQQYEDFIKDIKEKFQLNQNSKIFLTLVTKDDDDYNITSQDELDNYSDIIQYFNFEYEEAIEPVPVDPNVGQNPPMPELDVLDIDIDEIIKEVFDNDTYKKELEMNSKKLSDNFKSNLELSFNNIIEEKQKVIVNDIDSKLEIFINDFSQKQNENKNLVSEIKNAVDEIKTEVEQMNSGIKDYKDDLEKRKSSIIFKPNINPYQNNNNINNNNVIIDDKPINRVQFEQKNIEKIIEMKDAKFININDIKIKNVGNISAHKLFFIKNKEKSSNDFCFFGNSKATDEYELSMDGELKPNKSLNCNISVTINNPQPEKEYKAIIYSKENNEIISEPFEIIIKINKPKEDPIEQKQIQANQIYEEIKEQFPNHNSLINKDEIINKLIGNNLNRYEIINDINNKINEMQQKEDEEKAEQIYDELNINNINIDKNEIISIIKEKNFDKEEIQKWLNEKAKIQKKEKAQNLYNKIRNEQNLDFSKCNNEEAILNKIIELKFNENEIRNFFKAGEEDPEVIEIFNELEDGYNITSLKKKEEVIAKIKELKCDRDKIDKWVEAVINEEA